MNGAVPSVDKVARLLVPFGLKLNVSELEKIRIYLDLLARWNSKVNLTAIRQPEECITRNFGESLYLATKTELSGSLLDIGSGAGFPGLALKIVFPELAVTLLEPTAKKRAFLNEVVRVCEFTSVEVLRDRIEDYPPKTGASLSTLFDSVTARAVGGLTTLAPAAISRLKRDGRIFFWVSRRQVMGLTAVARLVAWHDPWLVPLSSSREIWHGSLRAANSS